MGQVRNNELKTKTYSNRIQYGQLQRYTNGCTCTLHYIFFLVVRETEIRGVGRQTHRIGIEQNVKR